MSYNFVQAEPVTITGTGAKKMENPFIEPVASIAWKTDKKTNKPVALSFVEEHSDDDKKTIRNRIRRFMKDAGDALEKPGTVRTAFADVADGTRVTFWVVPLQKRERKNKKES